MFFGRISNPSTRSFFEMWIFIMPVHDWNVIDSGYPLLLRNDLALAIFNIPCKENIFLYTHSLYCHLKKQRFSRWAQKHNLLRFLEEKRGSYWVCWVLQRDSLIYDRKCIKKRISFRCAQKLNIYITERCIRWDLLSIYLLRFPTFYLLNLLQKRTIGYIKMHISK